MVRNKLYADTFINGNKKWNDVRKESSSVHLIQNYDVRLNVYISNDDADVWSYYKPSDMLCIAKTQV